MILFALEVNLPGFHIERSKQLVPVLAYADNVTVFASHPAAYHTIHKAVRYFELAAGARLNPKKSKELAVGAWKEPATILLIEFQY